MRTSFELDNAADLPRAFKPEVTRQGNTILHAGQGKPIADATDLPGGGIRVDLRDDDATNYVNKDVVGWS